MSEGGPCLHSDCVIAPCEARDAYEVTCRTCQAKRTVTLEEIENHRSCSLRQWLSHREWK